LKTHKNVESPIGCAVIQLFACLAVWKYYLNFEDYKGKILQRF